MSTYTHTLTNVWQLVDRLPTVNYSFATVKSQTKLKAEALRLSDILADSKQLCVDFKKIRSELKNSMLIPSDAVKITKRIKELRSRIMATRLKIRITRFIVAKRNKIILNKVLHNFDILSIDINECIENLELIPALYSAYNNILNSEK